MEKEYKIAIIGGSDAISGFKAIGVEIIGVNSVDDCKEKFINAFNSGDYGVLFITEIWADKIKGFLEEIPLRALPAIVAVPSQSGSTGAGLSNLKKIIERAVGSDILANE